MIVVDPVTGALYDVTSYIVQPNSHSNTTYYAAFIKSTDGGDTWTAPQKIAQMFSVGVTDPNTGARVRVGDGIPSAAIDPATGRLYLAWEENASYKRGSGNTGWEDTVTVATSSDGGATWTLTSLVNDTHNGMPAFTPVVAANANGTVAVTYYDNRNLAPTNTTTLPTDYWVAYSTDGGASFAASNHVSGSFDMLTAVYARGHFVGDYQGLSANGTGFISVFGQANCPSGPCQPDNPQDIYATTRP